MKLGLGTAALGRPQYINIRNSENQFENLEAFKANSYQILDEAYRLGIRYFDTAPGYGLAEALLIDWIAAKNDETIQLATKWGYTYVANFDATAKIHEVKEHSLAKLNEQWETSKGLLPSLSVYQIHSATLETGVLKNNAVLERLAALKAEHNLKIGITTTGSNQVEVIKEALKITVNGNALFDAFQVTFNMLDQSILEVNTLLKSENKMLIVKEALANGRVFPNEKYQQYQAMYGVLKELAQKYHVGIDAIVLQFCVQMLQPTIVLSGASTMTHLEQNLKIEDIVLSASDLQRLAEFKISPVQYWDERKALQWN